MNERFIPITESPHQELPEHLRPSAYDRTLEGYIELHENLRITHNAVRRDFENQVNDPTDDGYQEFEENVTVVIADRSAEVNSLPPLPPTILDNIVPVNNRLPFNRVLSDWGDHFPQHPDDESKQKTWNTFLDNVPDSLHGNLSSMYEMHIKLSALQDDEELQSEFHEYRVDQIGVLRAAAVCRIVERKKAAIGKEISDIHKQASASRRRLTPYEERQIKLHKETINQLDEEHFSLINSEEKMRQVIEALGRGQALDDKRQLESGLLMTDQMESVISESVPALSRGEPALFVGETGGAKTALAMHIAKKYFNNKFEFVRGEGDLNSYKLMGRQVLREKNGASVSEFEEGPVVRAARNGWTLIIDEINASPPDTLKELNTVLPLKPGDTLRVSEGNYEVTVAPGFCVIATANEKSKRYKGVDDLSAEFKNRFGANTYRVRYPDHDRGYDEEPVENMRLIQAAVVDEKGELPPEIDEHQLYNLSRAARITQQIFSGEHGEGYRDFIDTNRITDNKPGLEDEVLAPRTVVDILKKVKGSYGEVSINMALGRFVDGIKNPNDKKVMATILNQHKLLKNQEEPESKP